MKILLLVLFLSATIIGNISGRSNRTRRMVNATICDIKEYPSLVSITSNVSYNTSTPAYVVANGVLLTMKWVLAFGNSYHRLDQSVYVAGTNHELDSGTDQVRTSKRYVEHRNNHHLFLIELSKPFDKNDRLQPAKVPNKANFLDGCSKLTLVGWGPTYVGEYYKALTDIRETNHGDLLKCGKAKHLQKSCYNDQPEQFCFQMEDPTRMCDDDDGFGVFSGDTLVGITIGGYKGSCYRNEAVDGYNITFFMGWLHENAGIEIPLQF